MLKYAFENSKTNYEFEECIEVIEIFTNDIDWTNEK
jgi:hypothetical protein